MARSATIYDLVLLLSTSAEEDVRSKILTDVESAINDAGGSIERGDQWGRRPLTYRIDHQGDAEFHLLQFSGPPALLESLQHSLRVADGVLRFRIIKVRPGTPAAPDSAPPLVGVASGGAPSASAAPTGTDEDPGAEV